MTSTFAHQDLPVTELRPNAWNTNHVSPENEEKIRNSILELGFFRPLIVRQVEGVSGYEILGGQHRWQVASGMGYEKLPAINVGYIDDDHAKKIGLVDNGRYGEDDTLALAELLKSLGDPEDIQSIMPYSDDQLDGIFSASSLSIDDLDIPEDSDEPLPQLATTAAQTHVILRFKIPIEDQDFVTRLIDGTATNQGFTDDDAMMNAGNALMHLLRGIK